MNEAPLEMGVKVIFADNVNEAFTIGINAIKDEGIQNTSRNGPVLMFPNMVVTTYRRPHQRVLFHPKRKCNHFFHFFESLWMLAGRNDLDFLVKFNPRMAEYSDDGKTSRGSAYGYRWKQHFGYDQIPQVINNLAKSPDSRRVVLSMWDPREDLTVNSKDIPCNNLVYFNIVQKRLNMTVVNRSNDLLWGAYGSNVFHFSFLQQYILHHLYEKNPEAIYEFGMGVYNQFSNNLHVYTDTEIWKRCSDIDRTPYDPYRSESLFSSSFVQKGESMQFWDEDLVKFFELWEKGDSDKGEDYKTYYFQKVVYPMYMSHERLKEKNFVEAKQFASQILSQDLQKACLDQIISREANA